MALRENMAGIRINRKYRQDWTGDFAVSDKKKISFLDLI
jgi:hypothetical protein